MNYTPLCGTDGVTYGNECQMTSLNCVRKTNVAVAHVGECVVEPVCNIACQYNYSPVCGSDGETYSNLCDFESQTCLKKSNAVVAYDGECASAIPAIPVCNEACLRNWVPICGTDGITYGNLCQMESFACQKRLNLLVAHEGEC